MFIKDGWDKYITMQNSKMAYRSFPCMIGNPKPEIIDVDGAYYFHANTDYPKYDMYLQILPNKITLCLKKTAYRIKNEISLNCTGFTKSDKNGNKFSAMKPIIDTTSYKTNNTIITTHPFYTTIENIEHDNNNSKFDLNIGTNMGFDEKNTQYIFKDMPLEYSDINGLLTIKIKDEIFYTFIVNKN